MQFCSGNEGVAIVQRYAHKQLTPQNESSVGQERPEVPKMLQEFDLPARWTSLIQDHFAEAVHNLAQMWPNSIFTLQIKPFDNSYWTQAIAICTHLFASSISQATKFEPFPNSEQMTSVTCSPSTQLLRKSQVCAHEFMLRPSNALLVVTPWSSTSQMNKN